MTEFALRNRRLLIVEDEYLLADELRAALTEAGASVIGPISNVASALAALAAEDTIDGAILDTNLQGEMVFSVADALLAKGIPFVFTTGYDAAIIPTRFGKVERLEKPTSMIKLCRTLENLIGR